MAVTFWDLLQAFRDETGASEAWVMRKSEVNKGTFSAWRQRGIPVLPPRRTLVLLSEVLKVPYESLLFTILNDTGYLPGRVAIESEVQLERDRIERRKNFDFNAWETLVAKAAEEHATKPPERFDLVFRAKDLSDEEWDELAARQDPRGRRSRGQLERDEAAGAGEESQEEQE